MWEGPGLENVWIRITILGYRVRSQDLHDGDILCQELGLDVPYIDLLELTVTDVFPLVGDTGAGTSDVDRR